MQKKFNYRTINERNNVILGYSTINTCLYDAYAGWGFSLCEFFVVSFIGTSCLTSPALVKFYSNSQQTSKLYHSAYGWQRFLHDTHKNFKSPMLLLSFVFSLTLLPFHDHFIITTSCCKHLFPYIFRAIQTGVQSCFNSSGMPFNIALLCHPPLLSVPYRT